MGLDFSKYQNIVIIGDSVAYGQEDQLKGGFAGRLREWRVNQKPEFNKVYNLGIAGDTTFDVINRITKELVQREPDLIIFNVGLNDCVRFEDKHNPPEIHLQQFQDNIYKIIEITKDIAEIAWIGLFPIDDHKTSPMENHKDCYYLLYDVMEYENKLKGICKENRIEYIEIMSDWLKRGFSDLLAEDGLHPNEKGHEYIFEKLIERK